MVVVAREGDLQSFSLGARWPYTELHHHAPVLLTGKDNALMYHVDIWRIEYTDVHRRAKWLQNAGAQHMCLRLGGSAFSEVVYIR